jgi:acyl-CoA reductase-like NAD-dependent aldehyde dehydrogenase
MSEAVIRTQETERWLYLLGDVSEEEVAEIYVRARQVAKHTMRKMPVRERVELARKCRQFILSKKEWIVDRICEETGKSRMDAMLTEIYPSLDLLTYYEKRAGDLLADKRVGTPLLFFPKKSRIFYEPFGTVLVISPWNYPFVLSFQPMISALIAGNSVVLKPSSNTPLRGVFERIFDSAGFPRDAVQVVYGSRITGMRLIDGRPDKILFTGGVSAGKSIMAQAAQYLIPVELELGGKDPMIVFDDVDLERAVNGALWGAFVNSGQTCTSVDRLYVQTSIYSAFVEQLKEKSLRLRTRPADGRFYDESEIDMGAMTADFQVRTVCELVDDARKKGAEVFPDEELDYEARQLKPMILTGVDESMRIFHEEIFGPVVTVTPFTTEDEAVRLANALPFGLSSSVWSGDTARAERVARALHTGSVSINNVLATHANSGLPFGGVKDSGFGRYRGEEGLLSFCYAKSVLVDRQLVPSEINWYPYTRIKYALLSRLIETLFSGKKMAMLRALPAGIRLQWAALRSRL